MHDIGICELPIDPSGLNVTRYRMQCVAVLPKVMRCVLMT